VFGFLDDTAVRTCRPGSGPVGEDDGPGRPRHRYANMIQISFYRYIYCCSMNNILYLFTNFTLNFLSGYLKAHGLKYQNVLCPKGMVAGVYGTSCSQNDRGMPNLSRLVIHLENLLHPDYVMTFGLLPSLYGDETFQGNNYSTIISCYELIGDNKEVELLSKINFRMSAICQSIEHMYGQLFNLFHLLKTLRQFKFTLNIVGHNLISIF
jgi:hypothetical protein